LNTTATSAVIRYTLDGSNPTRWSPIFAAPIPVNGTLTVTAQAYEADMIASGVVQAIYTINNGAVAIPSITPSSGFYATSRTVTISDSTTGATIHYTTTGRDPTSTDPTITSGGTVTVSQGTIVKAIAMKSGMANSAITRRDYIIGGAISTGWNHTLILQANGTVWAFGDNTSGDLGNGGTAPSTTPVQATGLPSVVAVAAGYYHSLALDSSGHVWSWGYNAQGQLGNGSSDGNPHSTPTQISGLSSIVAVAAGQYHSLALDSSGNLWSWGYNGDGELGNGSSDGSPHPTPAIAVSNSGFIAISAGYNHNLAIKNDSTVLGWGANSYGQIGDGTYTQRNSPVVVPNLSGITQVVAGNQASVVLRTEGMASGTVWTWGYNAQGQLGDGTNTSRPTLAEGPGNVVNLGAGDLHVVATLGDGRTVAWGEGTNGQLGDGTVYGNGGGELTPVVSLQATEMLQVTGGYQTSFALRADGTLWNWGYGYTNAPAAMPSYTVASNSGMLQDTDNDGLTNAAEYRLGTDPLNPDTNQDGIQDGAEVGMGLSPTNPDMDGDGLLNGYELLIGTNPFNPDTDGDGHLDGADCFPLDPTQWQCVVNPNDHTPPVITIDTPPNATPVH
jgi:alpha-tubulin suppressor-like RCC1 family protein